MKRLTSRLGNLRIDSDDALFSAERQRIVHSFLRQFVTCPCAWADAPTIRDC